MLKLNYIDEELERQLSDAGISIYNIDGKCKSNNDLMAQGIIDSYDPFPAARLKAKSLVVDQINDYTDSLYTSYPKIEQDTFPYQRAEIEAWENDVNALTPVIDSIAISKGVEREAQLKRVQSKVNQFKAVSNSLTAQRQALFDSIDAATNIDLINTIKFET